MSPWSTIRCLAFSPWIHASLLLGLSGVGAAACAIARPDLVVVEHVEFAGARHAGPGALRHLADLRNGTTMWSVDLARVARGVERHPWVRSARASRRWPDTVVVEVEEYVPVAVLHYDELYYVDADGVPFLRGDLPDLDHPHITGIDPGLARRHPALPHLAVKEALALIEALDRAGVADRAEISEVAFDETRGLTVHVGRSRVIFGLEGVDRQIQRLAALVERGEVDLRRPLWIDLAPAQVAIVRPAGAHDA